MARLLIGSSRYWRLVSARSPSTPVGSLFNQQSRRLLTTKDALGILNLAPRTRLTPAALRSAYLEAAKQCHPDTLKHQQNNDATTDTCKQEAAKQFRLVTQAYEVLQGSGVTTESEYDDYGITVEEDAAFRRACQERLGLRAEIVEESKQCPAFRDWLNGKTDAAHYWRVFFIQYGGLAPQLRPPVAGLLESNQEVKKSSTRRRRPSQSTKL